MPFKMEIDHISYIFGSFARRRQSQNEPNSPKRRSIDQPKISHDRSKSAPHTIPLAETPPHRAKSACKVTVTHNSLKCPLCHEDFIDPRVLPCLHTLCSRCLHQLEMEALSKPSDRRNTITGDSTKGRRNTIASEKSALVLSCPICCSDYQISSVGIKALPVNYLIQHRVVLAALNNHGTRLLCDMCSGDIAATSRCSECALSLCQECCDNHRRQRNFSSHEVLQLDEARRKGITNVRRQIMCLLHVDSELSMFCATCCQVICRECFTTNHRGHTHEPVARPARIYASNIKLALNKTRTIAEKTITASTKLQTTSQRIENHCNQVQGDIDQFIESYIKAIQEHRTKLHQEVQIAKMEKLRRVDQQLNDLQRQLNQTKDLLTFSEELLKDGTEVEFLTFVKPILKKLESCNQVYIPEIPVSESLQFLPEEAAQEMWNSCPLYGIVTTQTVCPSHCVLIQEGLQNIRVGKRTEIILELRDKNDTPLTRGGEKVAAEVRSRDATKTQNLQIEDRKNGSYHIHYAPDVAGKHTLTVTVRGQPVKDSPVVLLVRPFRPHHGLYHCCSFCSSGGLKDAMCGCGGKMPGGYKGCGHGHEGHPGRRHWSCCGNTMEHSECEKRNSTHYQFTL